MIEKVDVEKDKQEKQRFDAALAKFLRMYKAENGIGFVVSSNLEKGIFEIQIRE